MLRLVKQPYVQKSDIKLRVPWQGRKSCQNRIQDVTIQVFQKRLTRNLLVPLLSALVIGVALAPSQIDGGVPIWIEYGEGHRAAVVLLTQAEKQAKSGDLNNALASVNTALKGDPKFWPALYTRAEIYERQHKWQLAIQDCNELLRQYPSLVEAALLRAGVNAKAGRYAESLKEIDHVISIRPRQDGLARALDQRAWFRLSCPDPAFRNAQQALKDAKTACNLILWKDANMIDTLAIAYAETGDFDSAVRYEEKALRTKEITDNETKLCQEHLDLFKQHRSITSSR